VSMAVVPAAEHGSSDQATLAVQVIEAEAGFGRATLQELWRYRDLAVLLVRRDIAVRYRQTAVGALWAVVQPLGLAAVFAVFLGHLAKVPSQAGIPYALYAFSGMVMWLYLASALARAAESTVAAGSLISKVYFPRLVIPIVAVVAPLADFAVAFGELVIVMLAYGEVPGPEIVLVPLALALALTTALGLGLWCSALAVRYRDIQHVVPFFLLVALFITPITYPFSLVPESLQPVYALNPAVGVLEVYRWMLFGEMAAPAWVILIPVAMSAILLTSGTLFFTRAERSFADVV
jgi:lipopolysaccharide transport system permease protein